MFETTALIILASGESSRFSAGDKLMADLNGKPVLQHAIDITASHPFATRVAVVGANQLPRQNLLETARVDIVSNHAPQDGQAHSLSLALRHVRDRTQADRALILLADMPFVSSNLLQSVGAAMASDVPAVMAKSDDVQSPPALFRHAVFDMLIGLDGDRGARHIFNQLQGACTVSARAEELMDIDTVRDLERAETQIHG